MAAVEHKGGGSSPDPFLGIMQEAGFRKMELSGFKGPMSANIKKWHGRGWGKAIGMPLTDIYRNEIAGDFQGVFFALPLTDHDQPDPSQSILLLAPSEKSCNFAVIGPKQSADPEET